jgi:hypothetical protein
MRTLFGWNLIELMFYSLSPSPLNGERNEVSLADRIRKRDI